MSSGPDPMIDFAVACRAGRSRADALAIFLDTMHDEESIQGVVDDWIGAAVESAAKVLLDRVGATGQSGAGKAEDSGESTSAATKLLPEALIQRWGASVASGFGFTLPNGQRLGDCTRDDLTKAAATFSTFGKEAHQKSRWLLLIAQGLPADRTVREQYKATRLTELAIEAEKNIEIPA